MNKKNFDEHEAAAHLRSRELAQDKAQEQKRLDLLEQLPSILKKIFSEGVVEIYIVGSLTRPHQFGPHSDIDFVIKNFTGDRFEIWRTLEKEIDHPVEIILYENCPFQDHVDKFGMRLL